MESLKNALQVVFDGDAILFFIDFYITDGYLIIDGDDKILVTDDRYLSAAQKDAKGCKAIKGDINYLIDYAKSKNATTLQVNLEEISASTYKKLLNFGFNIEDYTVEFQKILSIKNEEQLSLIEKACEIAERAYEKSLKEISEGISERKLSAILEYNFKLFGADGVSFETIVAFGENSAVPHHVTCDRRLVKGDVVLMDFGCKYKGYCSDMTRTFIYGEPSEEFINCYEATLKAHISAVENIRDGMSGKEADEIARGVLRERGLEEYFTHSLGHGIGVKIHEYPRLSKSYEGLLSNGQVFSIEPGVYLDGKFGIRIEDTVKLADGKVKSFMTASKELKVIK